MKKTTVKLLLIAVSAIVFCAACSKKSGAGETQVVTVWYNNTGTEAEVYEQAIAAYNASQTKYKVEGMSVNDQQKLIVALASNEAPDVVKGSNSNLMTYQGNSLLEDLTPYIERDKFDLNAFSTTSIEANSVSGMVYALPLSAYSIQMYYNKDLLKAAGYSEPPKTVEEMYDMAVAATKLTAGGDIDVLGYPLFPLASARQELIYAFGGRWWSADGLKLTPQSKGVIESLNYNVRYRAKYGIDRVQAFVATANTNRYTENDMFFTGKQLFRLDGPWLTAMMKNFDSTVNYGITLTPSPASDQSSRGTSRFETDSVFIPVTAVHKDGAWDFIKWLSSAEGTKRILLSGGNLPALKALYEDADMLARPGYAEFIAALKEENGVQYPRINDFAEYTSLLNEYLDYVYSGQQTPEAAMASLADRAKSLK